MAKIFFNIRHRTFKDTNSFAAAMRYYDRDEASDKTSLQTEDPQLLKQDVAAMFSYYQFRPGSSGGFDYHGDKSYEQILREFKSYQPTSVYTSVLSLKMEDAIEFGLRTKQDFAALTRKTVSAVAKELGIRKSDLAWGGYYHTNKPDHPHVHFYMYDKRHPHRNIYLTKEQLKRIRAEIARGLIDRKMILTEKEDAKTDVLKAAKEGYSIDRLLQTLARHDVSFTTEKEMESRSCASPQYSPLLYQKLRELERCLPQTGRLSYRSRHMQPFKEQIDALVDVILHDHTVRPQWLLFLHRLEEVSEQNKDLYGESAQHTAYVREQMERVKAQLGNNVLSAIKLYRMQKQEIKEERHVYLIEDVRTLEKDMQKVLRKHSVHLLQHTLQSLAFTFHRMSNTMYARKHMQELLQGIREEEFEKRKEERKQEAEEELY